MINLKDIRKKIKIEDAFSKIHSEEKDVIDFYENVLYYKFLFPEAVRAYEHHCTLSSNPPIEYEGFGIFRRPKKVEKRLYYTFESFVQNYQYQRYSSLMRHHDSNWLTEWKGIERQEYVLFHINGLRKWYKEFMARLKSSYGKSDNKDITPYLIHKLMSESEINSILTLPKEEYKLPKLSFLSRSHLRVFRGVRWNDIGFNLLGWAIVILVACICIWAYSCGQLENLFVSVFAAALLGGIILIISVLLVDDNAKAWKQTLSILVPFLIIIGLFISIFTKNFERYERRNNTLYGSFVSYNTNTYNENLNDNLDLSVIVYTTETGECYHVNSSCISLSRSRNIYSCTKEDAISNGLRPCHNCTTR